MRSLGVRRLFRQARLGVALAVVAAALCSRAADGSAEELAWAAFLQSAPPAATERYRSPANELQELDLYLPKSVATKKNFATPVLILVHGGGWGGGTRDAFAPHARYFAALGWAVANISYRLTRPDVPLRDAQDDVRAAFAWVRAQAPQRGWDANRIVVLGESAGGQLACAVGVLPPRDAASRAHALVLVNPVLDLTTLPWALNQPGLREAGPFTAENAKTHPAYLASPVFQVTAESPPTLLIHGREDSVVPFAQAEAYVAHAKLVGAKVELVALEKTNHAFFLQQFGQPAVIRSTLARIAQFLGEP
jgi:acetyl esterase